MPQLPPYLLALAMTLIIEVPLYLAGLWALHRLGRPRSASDRRLRIGWAVVIAAGVNVLTHPVLWLVLTTGGAWTRHPWVLPGAEVAVVVTEGLLLWAVLRRDAGWMLVLALVVNAASYGIGLAAGLTGAFSGCG